MDHRYPTSTNLGLLLMRLVLAAVFLFHGSQKLFGLFGGGGIEGTAQFMESIAIPYPQASAVLVGLAEFIGGLALLTGIAMRLLIVPAAFAMFVASFTVHRHAFAAGDGGMEFPLTLAIVLCGLILTGPGGLAIGQRGAK